jgi:hypothetical protein
MMGVESVRRILAGMENVYLTRIMTMSGRVACKPLPSLTGLGFLFRVERRS